MTARRRLLRLAAGVAALALPAAARPAQPRSLADPLRLTVDDALVASGLAPRLLGGFGRETGVAVRLLPQPATAGLQALELGERDIALSNAPQLEAALERDGLAHDRRLVALSGFVLVGPAALAKPLAAGGDLGVALSRIALEQVLFVSRTDGSGTHLVEQAAWRTARTAPDGAWYVGSAPGRDLLDEARERRACALVERGVWAARGVAGYAVLAEGDPVPVHVLRSFRADHPAARLFATWLAGARGRAIVAAQRGYRPPPA